MVAVIRILFATDFSRDSAVALAMAKETAHRFEAEVIALHVDPGAGAARSSPAATVRREEARILLACACEEFARERISASPVLCSGDPAREILRVAADRGVGMIVLATHGETRSKNLLLGSVADRVLRHATMPVLTVRHPDRATPPLWSGFADRCN
jgi:nucleotide-binding universal stress UspA family protein